jgi:hypothetical protein
MKILLAILMLLYDYTPTDKAICIDAPGIRIRLKAGASYFRGF